MTLVPPLLSSACACAAVQYVNFCNDNTSLWKNCNILEALQILGP
jgi:hypothetical protein